ncbi:hypothetical protein HHL11_19485 [Ramlibacter sp. G-1-2-2]|uniref:Uncharacterized protein n=1 Tax=Ramlibacter agri TaxID=2728837 RepID=A0A848H8Z6_9BURK|nr:hypothetical protein [Ramlibacter agri]NML45941.1 hypothetical protein [Ramlibacter agri]
MLALREFVADPSLGIAYERDWEELPPFDRWLFQQACARLGRPALPKELCWFHGTRVPPTSDFSEGILPLGAWLPRLQAAVDATLDDVNMKREAAAAFARKGGFGMHFGMKVKDSLHWGPYAILVREVADYARTLGQHDYLGMPEIIEDLCEDVRLASGLELLPVLEQRWKPAVVKFTAPAGDSAGYAVAVALCYLREVALQGRPGHGAVWCFDGGNTPVPADRIVAVEWV